MGNAIQEYLQENDNQWPESIEALQPHYRGAVIFEDIEEYVQVDLNVNVCETIEKIQAGDLSLEEFQPISFTKGIKYNYEERRSDGNAIVFDYLKRQSCDEEHEPGKHW